MKLSSSLNHEVLRRSFRIKPPLFRAPIHPVFYDPRAAFDARWHNDRSRLPASKPKGEPVGCVSQEAIKPMHARLHAIKPREGEAARLAELCARISPIAARKRFRFLALKTIFASSFELPYNCRSNILWIPSQAAHQHGRRRNAPPLRREIPNYARNLSATRGPLEPC